MNQNETEDQVKKAIFKYKNIFKYISNIKNKITVPELYV